MIRRLRRIVIICTYTVPLNLDALGLGLGRAPRVAVLLRHDGARAILGEQELAAVARADDQTRATMLEGVGGVQVYLGDGDDYWCRCEAVDKVDGESKTTAGLGASPSPLASHVDDALGKYTRSLRLKAKEPCVEARFVADALSLIHI